jgi:hypothetical protein
MASVKWESGTNSTIMTTALNSLADAAHALSDEIDNTTVLYLFDYVEWYNAALGYTPAAGSVMELYLIRAKVDGTGFEDGDASTDPPATNLVGTFNIRAATAAQTHVIRQIPIPPSKFKYLVINSTGGTLPASGNTLRRVPYRYQTA